MWSSSGRPTEAAIRSPVVAAIRACDPSSPVSLRPSGDRYADKSVKLVWLVPRVPQLDSPGPEVCSAGRGGALPC